MTEVTLYRKYRPQTFSDFVGQEKVVSIIKRAIATSRLSHAYLFCGPRGTGKTTLARLLTKAINCQNRKEGEAEPCLRCENCESIAKGNFPDLIELDAASHRGIDEIREIRDKINFLPYKGKYKVYVIDEAHQLTKEAANALLKTLEEPPSHVIFVLATTEPEKILDTIRSRCQVFYFETLRLPEIIKKLKLISEKEGLKIKEEALEIIAKKARGSLRDAESLLQKFVSLKEEEIDTATVEAILGAVSKREVIEILENVIAKNTKRALEIVRVMYEENRDFKEIMLDLLKALRAMVLLKITQEKEPLLVEFTHSELEELERLALKVELKNLERMINVFLTAYSQLRFSPLPSLPLELAIVELCENF